MLPPYCVAWTQLPLVTQIAPVVGHTGLTDKLGAVHDFQGHNTVGVGNMAFCKPLRYWQLDVDLAKDFDGALSRADGDFSRRNHNICSNNCHHHVAHALNLMKYQGRQDWGQVDVAWRILTEGRWVKPKYALFVWFPFVAVVTAVVLLALFA
ncbi:MAG: uncharacterized protein KVP18_001217 [Porospora cf. gigantea A]|uniref:uncharacterized protein n=1 Tax=Porospora cf. gigantea A TaxID=2853593 RepID=UPI00355A174B|nr:MAG: hypothetical protein KVP18_001217 [Porospora cf. gigantea A]